VMIGMAFETQMEVLSEIVVVVVGCCVQGLLAYFYRVQSVNFRDSSFEYQVSSVMREIRCRELDAWRKDWVRACLSKGSKYRYRVDYIPASGIALD